MEPSSNLAPHRGGLILALGIVSLVACQLLGVAPWVMARADAQAMDEGRMDPSGRGLTDAGRILGIISLVLAGLSIIVAIGMLVFGLGIAAVSNS